jgi:hypothetical protein
MHYAREYKQIESKESSPMIAGVAFDLYRPLFTAAKLADLSGVKRPVIDTMATRGFIRASGREQPATPRRQSATKGTRRGVSKGRPLFSARDAFKVRLIRVLAAQAGLELGYSAFMGDKAKDWTITESELAQLVAVAESAEAAAEIADGPATQGEWMWAMARSIERGKPFYIYGYATRREDEWVFDMHIENPGVESPTERPCFGWRLPHIYVPVGEIFHRVYNDSKELLGISMESANSKGA